ncbi:MAG: NrfD/PsrC family molybdoenzyme membrane anchor subunit [Tepidisphaerales bacterium]
MLPDRRQFLRHMGWLTATASVGTEAAASEGGGHAAGPRDPSGVLVDLTMCVGCRLCEHACKKANGFEAGPVESYDDQSVFKEQRRPAPNAFTVVNAYTPDAGKPVYVKVNCLHCNHPACVSACIVGALRKQENGAVTYDAWKCIGCRYCMVACPFQIPAYSYDDAFTPRVLKCELCNHRTREGKSPGCVEACPRQAIIFDKRSKLLEVAHERIKQHPGQYVERVYGEHEIGGTSWLYLSRAAFENVGFVKLGEAAPPVLTEAIQHGVFKHGLPPLILYGTLGALMFITNPRRRAAVREAAAEGDGDVPAHRHHGLEARATRSSLADAPVVHTRQPVLALAGGGNESEVALAEAPAEEPAEKPAEHRTHGAGRHAVHDEEHEEHEEHHEEPQPARYTLLTPGVFLLLAMMLTGLAFGLYRFIFGLGAATNLDQQHPWGLWIAIDVASGVALAAGGFTSAFLTHVLHRERYHAVARPALLTAMLGYTFVCIGLQADLGRYYNVWHPMIMWQGNSVLFEVGICVMCYLNVLYLEFAPIFFERVIQEEARFPRLARLARLANPRFEQIMFLLVIAGCTLSCLHQSSLGNLMVIAPYKLHPLWWTPLSPLLFLMSAIALGFPMVIWESLFAGWSLKLKPEMNVLGPLARFVPFTLGAYLAVKIGDMIHRGTYVYLRDGSVQSWCWMGEVGLGVVLPLLMLLSRKVRQSPRLLFAAVMLVVCGVVFNRVNVFLVGYRPPYATRTYFPSFGEFAVTIGLIACLMLVYRLIVTYLPIISQPKAKAAV